MRQFIESFEHHFRGDSPQFVLKLVDGRKRRGDEAAGENIVKTHQRDVVWNSQFCSRMAVIAPSAIRSLPAKMAVGRAPVARISLVAR
jgi:hypothetical protein